MNKNYVKMQIVHGKKYIAETSDKLFKEYAEHLKFMISSSQEREKSLLSILKEIFSFWIIKKQKKF